MTSKLPPIVSPASRARSISAIIRCSTPESAQCGGERVEIDRKAGRHAFDDRDERLTVRLARGEKSQHASFILSEIFATSGRRSRDLPSDLRGPESCTASRT